MTVEPVVAIVGRPNVGKSTLFNRLVGGRPALVHDTAGLTRDNRYGRCDYSDVAFELVDTGGLDPDAASEIIGASIHKHAREAARNADLVMFVVDARSGITSVDRDLAQELRASGKTIVVAANKVDHKNRDALVNEFFELGIDPVFGISAEHGRGIDELLDYVDEQFADWERPAEPVPREEGDERIRLALVGKPNVGKSSIMNCLLGESRALVHDMPGTTTDPVDSPFSFEGSEYLLVDTAGIRRKSKVYEDIEKISVAMARSHIERADVVVHVIDATIGATDQDAKIAQLIKDGGAGVVVALNKADLLDDESLAAVRQSVDDQLHFLDYIPFVLTSALESQGLLKLMKKVAEVGEQAKRRISTSELNKFFEAVIEHKPPPIHRGKQVTIQYIAQVATRPPTFVLWANKPKGVSMSYRRFVHNQLRKHYAFRGVPIRVYFRAKRTNRKPKR